MKKVSLRAYSAILLCFAVIIGIVIYAVRYINNGENWAMYFSSSTSGATYTLLDKDGVKLAEMSPAGKYYANDATTRAACYHLVGDYAGNVGTGALQNFSGKLLGYNLITGIEKTDDVTLSLTVDADMNIAAYNALNGKKGAVLVYNYKTGETLCMMSSPTIDPLNPPETLQDGTYINRCLNAVFTPGSTFKLVTLAAAIENIDDLFDRSFTCNGSIEVMGVEINCTASHGTQTIEQALANSCNCAFGELALELGADTLEEYAAACGLTSSSTLDNIPTAAGTYDCDYTKSAALAWSGIGQYNDLVCPYAMLRLMGAIANHGVTVEPSLLGISHETTTLLDSDTADRIASLMNYNFVYKYNSSNFPGLNISAKSGTAEVDGQESHAWFVGFLNDDAHPYAFVVIVENGGGGLSVAGPVANAVLQVAVNG